jgi:hypothetical protein
MVQASTTTNKNFKVKNGLDVAGTATVSDIILGTAPIAFNSSTGRLEIQVNDVWLPIAVKDDIPTLSFMDIGLSIDYNGQPTYIVQANGVTPSGESKFVNGGGPSDTGDPSMIFDSGALV